MISTPKRFAGLAAAVLAAGALAACSSSSTSSPTTSSSSSTPVSGGTLHIVAASGPAHLDTVPSYYTADYQLTHAYTRQLLNYPSLPYTSTSSAGWTADTTPAADIATEVPSTANGGITNGGKTYTFHIKPGVDWNTSPARQVTSQDFLREFKAFFNPVSPVGNPVYYESTIAGLTAYANAETAYFAKKSNAPTAANITNFQNTHTISGHHDAGLVDDPVHADGAGQRLPRTCWRCRSRRPGRWSTTATCRTACSLTSTRSPTARTRSAPTSPASRSRWSGTRRGSSPPTRSGTTT